MTVNVVAPGPLDTPFFHGEENEQSTAYLAATSVHKRLGLPTEIAPVIGFLPSDETGWITALTIFVNGGFVSR
ncbi:MAG: SDR family oxidoreductase [Pseudomonadota bacterium]